MVERQLAAEAREQAGAHESSATLKPNTDLENLATGVELTLASVLQGAALSLLIPKTVELLASGTYAKLPYIPASLLLIFIVWVAFIGHALSFITWPFDPLHNFLYFLVAGSEAVLAALLDRPSQWFLALIGFALIMGFNLWYNQQLLLRQLGRYHGPAGQALYGHTMREQRTNLAFMAGYLAVGLLGFVSLSLRPTLGLPQEAGWVATGFGALLLPLAHVLWQARTVPVRARLIERARAEHVAT